MSLSLFYKKINSTCVMIKATTLGFGIEIEKGNRACSKQQKACHFESHGDR